MRSLPAPLVFIGLSIAYAIAGRVALELLGELWPRRTATAIVGVAWLIGWVWLIGAVILGPTGGWLLLRYWIALMGGLAIAVAPFAIVPHPGAFLLGIPAAIAFAGWCLGPGATR